MTPNLIAAVRRLERPADATDTELLARFARTRDDAAFRELVERHGPMVLAVCRRVLGCAHDADDAFQASFLVLARRAGAIRVRSVGDWLHGVAHRTALASRRAAARRRTHEARLIPTEQATSEDVAELRAVLDEELARLPTKYREVLVLADLQEKDRRQVAAELGVPEGTVASRHTRARSLLAGRLTRRGWGLPAYLLAATPVVAPDTLMAAVGAKAATFAAGLKLDAACGPEVLAREVLGTMTRKKLTAVAVVIALAGGGLAGLSASASGDGPSHPSSGRYSVATAGGTVLLLDATTGETWVLNTGKEPTWAPVRRVVPAPADRPAAEEAAPPKTGLEVTARIVPARSAQLAAPAPGIVAQVFVREGDAVKAEQALVDLNGGDAARHEVDACNAEVARARASFEHARAGANVIPASERNRAEADFQVAVAKLGVAQAKLQATRIKAPFDGTVISLGASAGEAVGLHSSEVAVVATLRDLHVLFDVSERDAAKVAVGRPCKVHVPAVDAEYEAVVVSVAPVVSKTTGTVGVRAKVKLPEEQNAVVPRPGSGATVRLAEMK